MPRVASRPPGNPATPATPAPAPLVTSAARAWRGVEIELHHFAGVDWLASIPRHVAGLHVSGAVNLLQSRGGRTWMRHVQPGDVTFTPCGEPKRFQHSGDNVVLLVMVDPWLVQRAVEDECRRAAPLEMLEVPGRPDPRLMAIGRQLLECLGAEGPATRMRAESHAYDLARHLATQYAAAKQSRCTDPPFHLTPRKLQRALEYIEAHVREDVSLADVAHELAMSPGHFAHAFKGSTGLAPHRYLVARRMELAKSLLRRTDLPITEIAHQVGYGTHSHFSVTFQRLTGQTPRDFRGLA